MSQDLAALLVSLCGWEVVDGHLSKSYTFPDFLQALAFVNRVGVLAEAANHHPEIELGWGRVRLELWTHDVDRLTQKDFALATEADKVVVARAAHPDFDDHGSLHWHRRLAEAKAQAKAEGKQLFVDFGRAACGQCRTLVEAVIPGEAVVELLRDRFVALAADADQAEPEVLALAQRLEGAVTLPLILVADAEGEFLWGHSGLISQPELATLLEQ